MNSISLEPPQHPSLPRTGSRPLIPAPPTSRHLTSPTTLLFPIPSSPPLPPLSPCLQIPVSVPSPPTNNPAAYTLSHSCNCFFPLLLSLFTSLKRTLHAHVTIVAHRARSPCTAFPVTFSVADTDARPVMLLGRYERNGKKSKNERARDRNGKVPRRGSDNECYGTGYRM